MTKMTTPLSSKQAATAYLKQGWQPCPLGKPGTESGKGIRITGWQKTAFQPDAFTDKNNVGITLGKMSGGLVALDFDCETTRDLAGVEGLLPATWTDGRGSGISHAYYETDETVGKKQTFRLYLKKHPNAMAALGVDQEETFTFTELLADGQQVMAYPSIHPSGELVKWTKTPGTKSPNHVPFDNVVKDAGLLSFMAAVIMTYPKKSGSRDETCMALTGAFIKAGYVGPRADFLVETVARLAGDDEWETRGKASGTAEKMAAGEAATGMTRLCEMLGLIEIQDLLRDWLQVEATAVETDAPTGDWLQEFNEQYFIVGEGKGFVYEKVWHRTLKREVLKKQEQTNFVRRYAHRTQMVGKRPMNVAALWLAHPQAVRYDRMVFAPGEPLELKGPRGSTERNQWTGWAVDAIEGTKHESLLKHICEHICCERWESRNTEPHYQYVIKWLASRIQFPDRPAYVALLMKGPPGSGKSFMSKYAGKIFGRAYLHSGNAAHTTSNFNSIFRSKLLVCVEEFFADKKGMNVIKTLVTEEDQTYEGKGDNLEEDANFVGLILTTNPDVAIPPNDRRFFVLDVTKDKTVANNKDYFGALADDRDNGGLESLLFFLENLDLDGFDIRTYPETDARARMINKGLFANNKILADLFFFFKKGGPQPDDSLYMDDGSLLIERDKLVKEWGVTAQILTRQMGLAGCGQPFRITDKDNNKGTTRYYKFSGGLDHHREAWKASHPDIIWTGPMADDWDLARPESEDDDIPF